MTEKNTTPKIEAKASDENQGFRPRQWVQISQKLF